MKMLKTVLIILISIIIAFPAVSQVSVNNENSVRPIPKGRKGSTKETSRIFKVRHYRSFFKGYGLELAKFNSISGRTFAVRAVP